MDILTAVRLFRAFAEAIRLHDLQKICVLLLELCSAIGLDKEVAELKNVVAAAQARDWSRLLSALSDLLQLVSTHLNYKPLMRFDQRTTLPGADKLIATDLDSEAHHWELHCGHKRGRKIEKNRNAMAAINPAAIMAIFEAVITVVRWWIDHKQGPMAETMHAPVTQPTPAADRPAGRK